MMRRPLSVSVSSLRDLVLPFEPKSGVLDHWGREMLSLFSPVELLFCGNDEFALRPRKRFDNLARITLRSTKSGRSVMRQAQSMAMDGSICDLRRSLESAFL